MRRTRDLLEELTWKQLDQEMEMYFELKEREYQEKRNRALQELSKEIDKGVE